MFTRGAGGRELTLHNGKHRLVIDSGVCIPVLGWACLKQKRMDSSSYSTPHTMLYDVDKTLVLCSSTLFLIIPSDTITTFAQGCKIGSNEIHAKH